METVRLSKEAFLPPLKRMRTHTGPVAQGFHRRDYDVVGEVESYLEHVAYGRENGRAFCPFTRRMLAEEGAFLGILSQPPDCFRLEKAARYLSQELSQISPGEVGRDIPPEFKSAILAFTHPECRTDSFGKCLTEAHAKVRQGFLERGQMLGAMYESHPDPEGDRRFNPSVPLLIARRMHERDRVFMKTPEAQEVFESFFPPVESN